MKHVFALVVLCLSIVTAHAGTPKADPYQPNWFEQIIQTLTGTQAETENPKTTPTIIKRNHHRKHGHRHASTTHKSHASAGGIKYHAPTLTKENAKLFEEFQEWHNKQQLYKLFNPI